MDIRFFYFMSTAERYRCEMLLSASSGRLTLCQSRSIADKLERRPQTHDSCVRIRLNNRTLGVGQQITLNLII
jgi:hypothetical protein